MSRGTCARSSFRRGVEQVAVQKIRHKKAILPATNQCKPLDTLVKWSLLEDEQTFYNDAAWAAFLPPTGLMMHRKPFPILLQLRAFLDQGVDFE